MKAFRFYLIAAVIVVCDQITKWAVTRSMTLNTSREILGPYFKLTYTLNPGGAFSLFQAANAVFIAVAVIASIALVVAFHRYQQRDLLVSAALSLALGGAIGNLIDRVRLHQVIDFFELPHWPVFNVADSAISVGIVLLCWHFVFRRSDEQPQSIAS